MNRLSLKRVLGITCVLALAITIWRVYSTFAMPVVRPHVGDGHFINTSWRFPWRTIGLPIPGYEINFDEFDLGTEFDATYHIEQLPSFGNHVGVYLSINDPERRFTHDESRKKLTARLEIEVTDRQGNTLCQVQHPLGEMVWADPEGGPNAYGLYKLDESFFSPNGAGQYRIHLHYSPDPALKNFRGFAHIRCGGSI
jgi:hypothetical protein